MGIFDVMGPIMIGPSSSHTAGAAKLGRMARLLFQREIEEVDIYFHGSFADTYQGHGTDRAVIGGLLGYLPDDVRIRNSLENAEELGLKFKFHTVNLRNVHPNTLMIELKSKDNSLSVTGSSVGGGSIVITRIDNTKVRMIGQLPTLWILHKDRPGEVGIITSVLGNYRLNIAYMQVLRNKKGDQGSCIIELDHKPNKYLINYLENMDDIKQVRYLPPL